MADSIKKDLKAQYRDREAVGGVYLIRNTLNGMLLIDAATDLSSIKNRFEFSLKTGSCVNMKLQKDWLKQGSSSFTLEILEEITKGDTQTDAGFKADVGLLKQIWLEKLSGEDFY